MKLKYLILALLPLGLAACQSSDMQKFGDNVVTILQQQNPSKTISAYEWHLDTGAAKHMIAKFDAEGRFSVATTCNTLGGAWKVDSNQLVIGNLMSSMMACSNEAMKQEQLAGQIFNKTVPFVLETANANAPTLTLMTTNGQRYVFTGKMTPETQYQGQADTIFLEISPQTKQCTGVARQTCLQVKEIKYNESGVKTQVDKDWTLFYDQIQGFQHSPNERQIIRVKRFVIKNPAADQSKYAYIYDMAVEREAIKGSL